MIIFKTSWLVNLTWISDKLVIFWLSDSSLWYSLWSWTTCFLQEESHWIHYQDFHLKCSDKLKFRLQFPVLRAQSWPKFLVYSIFPSLGGSYTLNLSLLYGAWCWSVQIIQVNYLLLWETFFMKLVFICCHNPNPIRHYSTAAKSNSYVDHLPLLYLEGLGDTLQVKGKPRSKTRVVKDRQNWQKRDVMRTFWREIWMN